MVEPNTERELDGLLPLVESRVRARVRTALTPTKNMQASRKHRRKFVDTLFHNPPFDERYVTVISHDQTLPGEVYAELVARGAPEECYVIAAGADRDGTTMPLYEAIDEAEDGTILICVPGQLAYYYGESVIGGGYQWIVERRS